MDAEDDNNVRPAQVDGDAGSEDSFRTASEYPDTRWYRIRRYFRERSWPPRAIVSLPLRRAMSGSHIPWVTYIIMGSCIFFISLYVTDLGLANYLAPDVVLIIATFVATFGLILLCCLRSYQRLVSFRPLESHHSNSYLMTGVYLFGSGTAFTILLRLFIYFHGRDSLHSCAAGMNYMTPLIPSAKNKTNHTTPASLTTFEGFCYIDLAYDIFRLIFTLAQIMFIQTFRAATFDISGWVKFVLYHTILVNVCVWMRYTLKETNLITLETSAFTSIDQIVERSLEIEEIMLPFILEFSLIVTGILHSISLQMKDLSLPVDDPLAPENRDAGPDAPQVGRSQPGFLIGIAVSLAFLTSAITIGARATRQNHRSRLFFYIFQAIVALAQLIAVSCLSHYLQDQSSHNHSAKPDDYLLLGGFFGTFVFDLFSGYSASKLTAEPNIQNKQIDTTIQIVLLVQICLLFLSRLFQTITIIGSRCFVPDIADDARIRSAGYVRQLSLFLLVTNLSFWTLDSFIDIKYQAETAYPGGSALFGSSWPKIVAFTYPLIIFYRFHAAAMLYELWSRFKYHRQQ